LANVACAELYKLTYRLRYLSVPYKLFKVVSNEWGVMSGVNKYFWVLFAAGFVGWCYTHPVIAGYIMGPGLIPYGYLQLKNKLLPYYIIIGCVAFAWVGLTAYAGISLALDMGFSDPYGGGATAFAILLPFVTGGLIIGGAVLAVLLHNWWWPEEGTEVQAGSRSI